MDEKTRVATGCEDCKDKSQKVKIKSWSLQCVDEKTRVAVKIVKTGSWNILRSRDPHFPTTCPNGDDQFLTTS